MKVTLGITAFLVVLVIYLFLRRPSATIIPALSLPISLLGTIALMPKLGTGVLLTDLDLAISSSQPVLTNSSASVWLDADDPARERRLTSALTAALPAVRCSASTAAGPKPPRRSGDPGAGSM